MCEYCESQEPKEIFGDTYNILMVQKNELYFLSREGDEDYELSGKIHYCPMCGRKLKEADDGND